MIVILTLFVAGVFLLAAEVILPGAILGIVGGVLMVAGVGVAFHDYGFNGGMIATTAAFVFAGAALYVEFVMLPKSRLARKLTLDDTVAGTSQPPVADRAAVIGREVVAVTALVPTGYVEFGGRRYEAFARDGHTRPGERLTVVDVDNFRLIVSKPSTPPSS